jgi:hypothetical protein
MFDHKQYWQDKQLRKQLSERNYVLNVKNIMQSLSGLFHREEPDKKPSPKGHARTQGERRVRRAKHRDMMRNHAN